MDHHSRVARRWLRAKDQCFNGTVSYAWIDPRGKVIEIDHDHHETWADEYVHAHFPDRYQDEVGSLKDDEHFRKPASRFLMMEGWVRAANAFAFQVYTIAEVPDRLWHVMVELVLGCVSSRLDPERDFVFVEEVGHEKRFTIADFVHRYGTREQEEQMYERLLNGRGRR